LNSSVIGVDGRIHEVFEGLEKKVELYKKLEVVEREELRSDAKNMIAIIKRSLQESIGKVDARVTGVDDKVGDLITNLEATKENVENTVRKINGKVAEFENYILFLHSKQPQTPQTAQSQPEQPATSIRRQQPKVRLQNSTIGAIKFASDQTADVLRQERPEDGLEPKFDYRSSTPSNDSDHSYGLSEKSTPEKLSISERNLCEPVH